jgi:hypothetical protein
MSGWFITDRKSDPFRFRIPDGTILQPGGYVVFYEYQFNRFPGIAPSFALSSSHGEDLYLFTADLLGNLTGFRTDTKCGAAPDAVSIGTYQTSQGIDFTALSQRTFGADNPASLTQFRTGTGLPNAYPKVGPVVINEIHYHPPDIISNGTTNDNSLDEFIELYNFSGNSVQLFDPVYPTNHWKLAKAVDFDFPPGLTRASGGHLVVVSFDPSVDATSRAAFQQHYGTNAVLVGPYSGKLDNSGEKIELYKPDPPQADGFVPYVLVERIVYADNAPWPTNADGGGASLQRINVLAYGNDPVNWVGSAPTAGAALDRDHDGLPDWWEITYNLDPLSAADALDDSDGDGLSNLEEFNSGTNPQDATSFLRIQISSASPSGALLRFNAIAGKSYTLLKRDVLLGEEWTGITNIPPQSVTHEVTVSDSNTNSQRFYRLSTP